MTKTANLTFYEKEENGQITCQLHKNGKIVCEAVLLGRGHLMNIWSNPTNKGYGTKMLEYIEKIAFEKGLRKFTVSQIKDDKKVKGFFEKRGYKLKQNAQVSDEFDGEKSL